MNSLERFKEVFGNSYKPPAELVTAHECELRAAGWLVRWIEARRLAHNRLVGEFGPEAVQAAGLTELPNPRQVMADLACAVERPRGDKWNTDTIRSLVFLLSSTLEPVLERLPEPE